MVPFRKQLIQSNIRLVKPLHLFIIYRNNLGQDIPNVSMLMTPSPTAPTAPAQAFEYLQSVLEKLQEQLGHLFSTNQNHFED